MLVEQLVLQAAVARVPQGCALKHSDAPAPPFNSCGSCFTLLMRSELPAQTAPLPARQKVSAGATEQGHLLLQVQVQAGQANIP